MNREGYASDDRDITPVTFTRASYTADELPIESLILMVNPHTEGELMSLFCANKQWLITLSNGASTVTITWQDFIKIFAEFSAFVAQQGLAMLEECEQKP